MKSVTTSFATYYRSHKLSGHIEVEVEHLSHALYTCTTICWYTRPYLSHAMKRMHMTNRSMHCEVVKLTLVYLFGIKALSGINKRELNLIIILKKMQRKDRFTSFSRGWKFKQ